MDDCIKYTADDEEPKCHRCDHCFGDDSWCNKCGAEHWWFNYVRTEFRNKKKNKESDE